MTSGARSRTRSRRLKAGDALGPLLTVLGAIDAESVDPVYLVWHHKSWCPMACKVFGSMARAEKEAKMLSSLSHPNIVRVLGVERPGLMLMPFLEGRSLSAMIDGAPNGVLPISTALRVAIHVGAALQHVHAEGMLHLDVKPCNVIIARGGVPILFDFGTARRIAAARPAEVTGTDPYIAPEECRRERPGTAADVFGLGVTLYEMLTGELPFGEPTARVPFPQLSFPAAPLRRNRPRAPAALAALVQSCLEGVPAARPSLADLLVQLNRLITSGPAMWPHNFHPQRIASSA